MNTLRELQYAGLVEIQKQGCGKPNRIFPKSYEAVPNTDFKKSGSGTPEDVYKRQILDTGATVRHAAREFKISKSTIHTEVIN